MSTLHLLPLAAERPTREYEQRARGKGDAEGQDLTRTRTPFFSAELPRKRNKMTGNQSWYVYVVECADGTLYTGISTDVARRFKEHNAGRGARYTAARRPVTLRASWHFQDRRSAMLAETSLKRRSRESKKRLLKAAGDFRDGVWDLRRD